MKFLSFTHNGLSSFGVIDNQDILDLGAVNPDLIDLRDAIKKDRLNELAKQAQKLEPSFSINEIEFLPTIPNPEKIICIGLTMPIEMLNIKMDQNHLNIPVYLCERVNHWWVINKILWTRQNQTNSTMKVKLS